MKNGTSSRLVLTVIVGVFLALAPISADNLQKIIPTSSDLITGIRFLYMEQGLRAPSNSGPWSVDELQRMLDQVETSELSSAGAATYAYVQSVLSEETASQESSERVRFGLDSTLEVYTHTDTDPAGFFTDEEDWIYDYEEREPFLNVSLETWLTDQFYGVFEFPLKMNLFRETKVTSSIYNESLATNIPAVPPNEVFDLNFNFPERAYVSAGGDHWNVQLGRDLIDWGSGKTGNMLISDHLANHDFLRFSTFHDSFKYSYLAAFFPHPIDYGYAPLYDGTAGSPGQTDPVNGLRMMIAHRLEFGVLPTLRLAVTEAMMYMSETGQLDLRALNPAMLYHNMYIRSNSNSMLTLDLDFTPIPNLTLYGQFAVDEFALPGEPIVGNGALPQAFGYLGGIEGILPLDNGYLHGSFEAAKTDPYLYLRDEGDDYNQSIGEYGINYVVAIRHFTPDGNVSVSEEFLGYEYGCDAIVLQGTTGYKSFGKWEVEGRIFYMLHGTHDKNTLWKQGTSTDPDDPTMVQTPTETPAAPGNQDPAADLRDAVEKTLLLEVKGRYRIVDTLAVYGQLDWIHVTNPDNFLANGTASDLQISAGVTYSL